MDTEFLNVLPSHLLPEPARLNVRPGNYDPTHCLAVYHYAGGGKSETLQLPSILAGEAAASISGQGCTLLEGIPEKPPGGCVVVTLWEDLLAQRPGLARDLSPPEGHDGYVIRLERYALLTATSHAGLVCAAQTFVQMMACVWNRKLPGLVIHDAPRHRYRSLLYDARGHHLRIEGLMRLAALLSSFKGNRLHLVVPQDLTPESATPQSTLMTGQDAQQLQQVCREYGVEVIPWLDMNAPLGGERLSVQQATDTAIAMAEMFQATGVGVFPGEPGEAKTEPQTELVRQILQADPTGRDVYAGTEVCQALCTGQPPGRLIAAVRHGSCPADVLQELREQSVPMAIFADSGDRGFVPADPAVLARQIGHAAEEAHAAGALEFGYHCGPLQRGRLWENELTPTLACVTLGWGNPEDAGAAMKRFNSLAYADAEPLVVEAWNAIRDCIPDLLRSPESAPLQDVAFGFPTDSATWERLREIAWDPIEAKILHAENALRLCRNRLPRNVETLDHAEIGLTCMRLLSCILQAMSRVRAHYAAANRGRAGSLAHAIEAIDQLLEAIPYHIARIDSAHQATGACSRERTQLHDFLRRLHSIRSALQEVTHSTDLPSPESLGLLPL